ncbi:hypothetical protein N7519_005827 [Penicillium mononematosum]|uniref:uncharacterized protein n=1 Tax=Penicillium mononematosum TaxID=268346 RepID=UPI002548A572|nr:uncharacterized protein N7519_005827 [Penicillium mononematosum]KAJ6184526.1 hypothetical protein N7519_005827 [Penicillium mononematosum]
MRFSLFTVLSAVASLGNALPGKLQTRDVSASELNQFGFWVQYAAATYYVENYEAQVGDKISCSKGNCPEVEKTGATVFYDFSDDATFIHTNPDLCDGCLAELGFWSSWKLVRDDIIKELKDAVSQNPEYELVVVGHSLGAAVATLAAADLRGKGYPSAKLYAYASPRVANAALAKYITAQGNNYRFTHTNDPVPKLPLLSMGYVHVSPEYWITSPNNATVGTSDIKVIEGDVSFDGNTGTGLPLLTDFEAHVWYFVHVDAGKGPGLPFKRGLI